MPKPKIANRQTLFGPVMSLLFTISAFFGSQFWAAAFISPFVSLNYKDSANTAELLGNNPWLSFVFILLLEAIILWTVYTLINVEFNSNFTTLGLNKVQLKYLGYALAGFVAYFVFYIVGLIVAKALVPSLNLEQKQEIGFSTGTRGIELLPVFLSLVILAPITEEIVARGFLYGGLRTKLPFVVAASITSALFAVAHLGEASDGLLWVAAVDTFILSLVLCYLREKTNSLWPSIGVHALKNGLAFVVLFNVVQYFR